VAPGGGAGTNWLFRREIRIKDSAAFKAFSILWLIVKDRFLEKIEIAVVTIMDKSTKRD
jgi:hypothetical protein